jgi:hypothetical protein
VVLGLERKTSSHSTTPFWDEFFFEIVSQELFAWAAFEL